MELSLKAAQKLEGERIGIMHYPPFTQDKKPSEFTQLYTAYGVKTVIYGHLHGKKVHKAGLENLTIEGTRYLLTSCDQLDFKLLRVR